MLLAAQSGGGVERSNQQGHSPPADDNATPSQKRKRRSAAERRASHRRRSSAANDLQLAQLLSGLQQQQRRTSFSKEGESNGTSGLDEEEEEEAEASRKSFSPIPDNNEDEESVVQDEPPEPNVPAPGEGELELEGNGVLGQLLVEQWGAMAQEEDEEQRTDDTFRQSTPAAGEQLKMMKVLNVPSSPYQHRRSVSADHHLLQSVTIRRGELLENAAEGAETTAGMAAQFWNRSQEQTHSHLPTESSDREQQMVARRHPALDLVHSISSVGRKIPQISRKAPMLGHTRRHEQSLSGALLLAEDVRIRAGTELANELRSRRPVPGKASAVAECMSSPERTLSPAKGGAGTTGTESGNEGWMGEVAKSKRKRRETSVSADSVPCSLHSAPCSSAAIAQSVDLFTARRQYSDTNLSGLITSNSGRRSFKWKSLWGGGRKEEGNQPSKGEEKEGEISSMKENLPKKIKARSKNSFSACAGHQYLDPLVEDGTDETEKEELERKKSSVVRRPAAVRMRANSSTEDQPGEERVSSGRDSPDEDTTELSQQHKKQLQQQRRPFSLIGWHEVLATESADEGRRATATRGLATNSSSELREKYRVRDEDARRLEQFLREKAIGPEAVGADEDDEMSDEAEEHCLQQQLRMLRCSRRGVAPSPAVQPAWLMCNNSCASPTHGIRPATAERRLRRMISTRTVAANQTLTMPRKKKSTAAPSSQAISTLRRHRGKGTVNTTAQQLARRKSTHLLMLDTMMQKTMMKANDGTGDPIEATNVDEQLERTEGGTARKERHSVGVVVRDNSKNNTAAKANRISVSTSSLRQLLGGGGERKLSGNRSKVAPKIPVNSVKSELGTMDSVRERMAEKEKKQRESKSNSMILGTIWSIRPRRKKNDARSLANLFGQPQNKADTEGNIGTAGLPDVLASVLGPTSPGHHLGADLSCSPSFPFDSPDLSTTATPLSPAATFVRPQLVRSKWEDLDLWAEETTSSWSAKYPDESRTLDAGEKKRQNIIHELLLTERNHCQVLVLLREVYQEGLFRNGILDRESIKQLIPDVLDVLLDFHLTLLRRLRGRCAESALVRDISDIVRTEFEGPLRTGAIDAYTAFCIAREHSYRSHAALLAQRPLFRKFVEHHEGEYKERSFKACMLLITQRLTKYPILIEQILKFESAPEQRQRMQQAHSAVKAFALEVDRELLRHERNSQWELLKRALDKSTAAKLIDPKGKQDFGYEDLVGPVEAEGQRKVHLVARVFWRETMTSPDVELRLLLCDDIIVFLRPKGHSSANGTGLLERKEPSVQFFRHNSHSGVLPLFNTLVKGENAKRKSLWLIVTDKEKPDLIHLSFGTATELEQCVQAIKQAKASAPNFVRLASGRCFELSERSIGEMGKAEREYQSEMERWQTELEHLFAAFDEGELLIAYFERRMAFSDAVRAHLLKCPLRTAAPFQGDEQQRKQAAERERERMTNLLRPRFDELRKKRASALNPLVERARRMKSAELLDFVDHLYELEAEHSSRPVQQSSGSDEPLAHGSSGGEDETRAGTSTEGKRKPRRVRTYHGTADQKKHSLSSSGGSGGAHPIRRHTTVPAAKCTHDSSSDEGEGQRESDELRCRLSLHMDSRSLRDATALIRENMHLRVQFAQMKKELALRDVQLTSMRATRKGPSGETPEKLESLKQRYDALRIEQRDFAAKCESREQELWEREQKINAREREFQRREAELSLGGNNPQQPPLTLPNGLFSTTPTSAPKTTSNPAMRISNTYCGAGPVPVRVEEQRNPPANREEAGSGCRKALSQAELPRHLAVKTETVPKETAEKARRRKN